MNSNIGKGVIKKNEKFPHILIKNIFKG